MCIIIILLIIIYYHYFYQSKKFLLETIQIKNCKFKFNIMSIHL